MINHSEDVELSMRFEGLAMNVFECDRWADPWKIANAGTFDAHLVPKPDQKCREMLHTVTDVALWKLRDSEDMVHALLLIKADIDKMDTQEQAGDIVDALIFLMQESTD